MDLLLSLLLISTFSMTGLLALWAAASPLPWPVRAGVLLAVLALVAQLRSAEPLGVVALQLTVAIGGIHLRRWRRGSLRPGTRLRFTLANALLLVAATAVVVAITRRSYEIAREFDGIEWKTIGLAGAVAGAATLLAAWSSKSWRRLSIGLLWALMLSGVVATAILYSQSEILDVVRSYRTTARAVGRDPWGAALWFGATAAFGVWGVMTGGCCLAQWSRHSGAGWTRRLAPALIGAMIAVLPGYVYWRLLTPLPIPDVQPPVPNGADDVIAAGQQLSVRSINNFRETPIDQLAVDVTRLSAAFDLAERGLSREFLAPLDYPSTRYLNYGQYFDAFRALTRAFAARARVALAHGRGDDAGRDYERMLQLSTALTSGGLVIHWLVAYAQEDVTASEIWAARESLGVDACRRLVDAIQHLQDSSEPMANVLHRDRIWDENAGGIYGHLGVILADFHGGTWVHRLMLDRFPPRRNAELELLKTELALWAYRRARDDMPDALEKLVPEFLRALPVDPYSVDGALLRYQRRAHDYVVYSIGPDHTDNAGTAPDRKVDGWRDQFWSGELPGDLMLSILHEHETN